MQVYVLLDVGPEDGICMVKHDVHLYGSAQHAQYVQIQSSAELPGISDFKS